MPARAPSPHWGARWEQGSGVGAVAARQAGASPSKGHSVWASRGMALRPSRGLDSV